MGYQNVRLGTALLLSYLGLPGSSGLPEKCQKHGIFGIFWPKWDRFGEHDHIVEDTRPYGVPKCSSR